MSDEFQGARGYAPCWPFKCIYLDGEWYFDMNILIESFWWAFIYPFWDGVVRLKVECDVDED